jgi:hypothetical protein
VNPFDHQQATSLQRSEDIFGAVSERTHGASQLTTAVLEFFLPPR